MEKKLLIFDLDGTLFLSKESYRLILSELIGVKYNKDPKAILKSYNFAETLMEKDKEYKTADDFFKEFNSIFLEQIGIKATEESLEDLQEIIKEMKRRAPTELKMYPLAKETLEELKNQGYKIALLTGSWEKKIEVFSDEYINSKVERVNQLLKNAGIHSLFDKIFVAYVDRILKPNPEAFQKVLDYFKISPDQAIMIGDSEADIKASGIGIKTILFNPKGEYNEKTQPHYQFKDFSELVDLVNSIN